MADPAESERRSQPGEAGYAAYSYSVTASARVTHRVLRVPGVLRRGARPPFIHRTGGSFLSGQAAE